MAGLLGAYDRMLQRRPLLVKTLTSAALFGLGDVLSQKLEGKESFDAVRLGRMALWGACFAPLAHVWYGGLDKVITATGTTGVVAKVAADQLIWTPPLNSLFFFYSTWMETGDADKGVAAISEKLWPTLKVNWVVWPVLQAVNMSVVPLQYRLLYINVCSIFWSAFLSGQANSGGGAKSGGSAAVLQ